MANKRLNDLPEATSWTVGDVVPIDGLTTRKIAVANLLAGVGGAPGGSTTQVQYNNGGVLGGITGATTNGTALTLVAPNLGTPASGTATNLTGLPLTTGVTGTLPVANGGTGDTGSAWTVTSPTVTASSGTFTTVACSFRYKRLGKTAIFVATVTITTAGTATGNIIFDMPFTPTVPHAGGGKEILAVGFQCNWQTSGTQLIVAKYDNTTIIASGRTVVITGTIETT